MWADAPKDIYDPAYAESLDLMHETFEQVQEGRELKLATIRHIVELLVQKVAGSSAALAQILAVKLYENLTYCHSVNVATLSLLIAKQIGFRRGDDRRHRRSGAVARHRQDADSRSR